jgi:hypothetical protein
MKANVTKPRADPTDSLVGPILLPRFTIGFKP